MSLFTSSFRTICVLHIINYEPVYTSEQIMALVNSYCYTHRSPLHICYIKYFSWFYSKHIDIHNMRDTVYAINQTWFIQLCGFNFFRITTKRADVRNPLVGMQRWIDQSTHTAMCKHKKAKKQCPHSFNKDENDNWKNHHVNTTEQETMNIYSKHKQL